MNTVSRSSVFTAQTSQSHSIQHVIEKSAFNLQSESCRPFCSVPMTPTSSNEEHDNGSSPQVDDWNTVLLSDLGIDVSDDFDLHPTVEDELPLLPDQRLCCIGDVHGDFEALCAFLRRAEVYDKEKDAWIGGNTILVQCGDVLDRGCQELQCYKLLCKLSHQSVKDGGRVILLAGNHEVWNSQGKFYFVTSDIEFRQYLEPKLEAKEIFADEAWQMRYLGLDKAPAHPYRWALWEPGGLLAKPLLSKMKISVKVGSTVCVHGGLKKEHFCEAESENTNEDENNVSMSSLMDVDISGENEGENPAAKKPDSTAPTLTLTDINHAYQNWILGMVDGHDSSIAATSLEQMQIALQGPSNSVILGVPQEAGMIRTRFYAHTTPSILQPFDSPIMLDSYSSDAPSYFSARKTQVEAERAAQLNTVLNYLDCKRIVMGHVIQGGITGAFDEKAWRIDVGASKGCHSGTPEVLQVVNETVTILSEHGKQIPASQRVKGRVSNGAIVVCKEAKFLS